MWLRPQYKYPLKAQKTGRAGLQRPSLDICVRVTSRTPGLLWCVRAGARGTRWGLLLFLTLKGESEKSLTLRWSQSRLKIAANYPHMCCSGKNITDRRLHFISNALSHVTAVLFKLMKVQQREKEEVEQEFTGSLGTNCYFSAIYLVKEALYWFWTVDNSAWETSRSSSGEALPSLEKDIQDAFWGYCDLNYSSGDELMRQVNQSLTSLVKTEYMYCIYRPQRAKSAIRGNLTHFQHRSDMSIHNTRCNKVL